MNFFQNQLHKSAAERNEMLRSIFMTAVGEYSLIFIDESAKDERSLSREYGYALMNRRAQKKIVFVRGKRYSILPALSLEGIIGFEVIEGGYDKEKFKNFIFSKVVSHSFVLYYIYFRFHIPE